jgi:hypothetical protein
MLVMFLLISCVSPRESERSKANLETPDTPSDFVWRDCVVRNGEIPPSITLRYIEAALWAYDAGSSEDFSQIHEMIRLSENCEADPTMNPIALKYWNGFRPRLQTLIVALPENAGRESSDSLDDKDERLR